MERTFTDDRVQKVNTSECSGHNGIDCVSSSLYLQLRPASDVGKDIPFAHLNESQLNVVAVGEEV